MDHIPDKDVKLVISGVDEFGTYASIDHAIQERILPAAGQVAQDFYIVSPFLIPDLIRPMEKSEIKKSAFDRDYGLLRDWFRKFVELDGTRINLITNNLTYGGDDDWFREKRCEFARILLGEYGQDHMVSVFQIAEDKLNQTSSGIHAKALIAGRRAAYLGSGNITRSGFIRNIEFGALFLGYHEIAGELLETCRGLVTSEYFEGVTLGRNGLIVK